MAAPENSDEITVNNKTWNKLHETATKSGYRDGISEGRESNFQSSFDEGYIQGLNNGFALGLYKGALSITENLDEMLLKTSRGNCEICKDKSIEEKQIPELIALQTKSTNKILQNLNNKYQSGTSVNLPEKLN